MIVQWTRRVGLVLFGALVAPSLLSCTLLFAFDAAPEDAAPGDILGRTVKQNPDGVVSGAAIDVRGARPYVSDADGDFHVRGLAPGAWQLSFVEDVEPDGIAERIASRFVLLTIEPHLDGFVAEDRLNFVVLGDVVLSGPGVISGTVVEQNGDLVEGARVYAVSSLLDEANQIEYASAILDSATTDVRGRYYLLDVPAGDVKVFAILEETEDFRRASDLLEKFADPENPESEVALTLEPTPLADTEVQVILTPDDLVEGNSFDVYVAPAGAPIADDAAPALSAVSVGSDGLFVLPVPAGFPVDVYVTTAAGTPRGLLSAAIALPVEPQPAWGPILLVPEDGACFRVPGEQNVPERLDEAANDCDADSYLGLPTLGPDRLDPFVNFDIENLWEACATACDNRDGDAFCEIEDDDGNLVTFSCESVDGANAWSQCYTQCTDDAAPLTCQVGGFDGVVYEFDCDDDGDGQVDATENPDCVGIGLGGDRDGDGLCDSVDPFPYCAGDVPDPGPCPGCEQPNEDGLCVGQYTPPPLVPDLPDAGPPADAGVDDAGLIDDGGPSEDGGFDLDAGQPADAGLDAGIDAGVDAGPVFVIDDHPVVPAGVALGDGHTCGVSVTGPLWCFGENTVGELGHDTTGVDNQPPSEVTGAAGLAGEALVETSAGDAFTCVLADTQPASVHCVGDNSAGQLGPGVVGGSSTAFAEVPLVNPPVRIASGAAHTCALTEAGDLECWGDNGRTQLGAAGTPPQPVVINPAAIGGAGATFVDVAAGGATTCAVLSAPAQPDALYCWGAGDQGQLGDGNSIDSATPALVAGGLELVRPAVGSAHVCAVEASSGDGYCWGASADGRLGQASPGNSTVPGRVDNGASGFVQFALGDAFTCARHVDGEVRCFGDNSQGQLGDAAAPGGPEAQVVPGLLSDPEGVSAGARHACARYGGGRLFCWGDNAHGQAGIDNAMSPVPPVEVPLARIARWLGGLGNDFSEADNWDVGVVPGPDDLVIFGSDALGDCDLDSAPPAPGMAGRQVLGLRIETGFVHGVVGSTNFMFGTQLTDAAGALNHGGVLAGQINAVAVAVDLQAATQFGDIEVLAENCVATIRGTGGLVNLGCGPGTGVVDVAEGTFVGVNVFGAGVNLAAAATAGNMDLGPGAVADIAGTVLFQVIVGTDADARILPGASVVEVEVSPAMGTTAVLTLDEVISGPVRAQHGAQIDIGGSGGASSLLTGGAASLGPLQNANITTQGGASLGDVNLFGTFSATLNGDVSGSLNVQNDGTGLAGDVVCSLGGVAGDSVQVNGPAQLNVTAGGSVVGPLTGFEGVELTNDGVVDGVFLSTTGPGLVVQGTGTYGDVDVLGPSVVTFAGGAQANDVLTDPGFGNALVTIEAGSTLANLTAGGDATVTNEGTIGTMPADGVRLQDGLAPYPAFTNLSGGIVGLLDIGSGTSVTLELGSTLIEGLRLAGSLAGPPANLTVLGPTIPTLEVPNGLTPFQVDLQTSMTINNVTIGSGAASGYTDMVAPGGPQTVTINGAITRLDASLLRFGPNITVDIGPGVGNLDGLEFVGPLNLTGGTPDTSQANIFGPVTVLADTTLAGALFVPGDGPGGTAPGVTVQAGVTLSAAGFDIFGQDPDAGCFVNGTLDMGGGNLSCSALDIASGGAVLNVVDVASTDMFVAGTLDSTGNAELGAGVAIPFCTVDGTWTLNGGSGNCGQLTVTGDVNIANAVLSVDTDYVQESLPSASTTVSGASGTLNALNNLVLDTGTLTVDTGAVAGAANTTSITGAATIDAGTLTGGTITVSGPLDLQNGANASAANVDFVGAGPTTISDTSTITASALQAGGTHVLNINGTAGGPHLQFDSLELVGSSTVDLNNGVMSQNAGPADLHVRDAATLQLDGGTLSLPNGLVADLGITANPTINLAGTTVTAVVLRVLEDTSLMSGGSLNVDYIDVGTNGTLLHTGGAITATGAVSGVLGLYSMSAAGASFTAAGLIADGRVEQSAGTILVSGGPTSVAPTAQALVENIVISGGGFTSDGIVLDGGVGMDISGGTVTVGDNFGFDVRTTLDITGGTVFAEQLAVGLPAPATTGTLTATAGSVTADALYVEDGSATFGGTASLNVNGTDTGTDYVRVGSAGTLNLGGTSHVINVADAFALDVSGPINHTAGTFNVNNSTVVQPSASIIHTSTGAAIYGTTLQIHNGGTVGQGPATLDVTGALIVDGDFVGNAAHAMNIDDLTVNFSGDFTAPSTLRLFRHLFIEGAFAHNSGEVIFDPSGPGAGGCSANADFCADNLNLPVFNDLTVNAPNRCVEFLAFSSIVDFEVDGTLTFMGDAANDLALDSDCSQAFSALPWTIQANGTVDVDFVAVQDSNNVSALYITPNNFTDLGGNNRWGNEITCPNGRLDGIEQCDDGNTFNGDGCSSACLIEPAGGAIFVWNGNIDSNWSDEGNWEDDVGAPVLSPPAASDLVIITDPAGGNDPLINVFTPAVGALHIDNTFTGALSIDGQTFIVNTSFLAENGSVDVLNSGTFQVDGSFHHPGNVINADATSLIRTGGATLLDPAAFDTLGTTTIEFRPNTTGVTYDTAATDLTGLQLASGFLNGGAVLQGDINVTGNLEVQTYGTNQANFSAAPGQVINITVGGDFGPVGGIGCGAPFALFLDPDVHLDVAGDFTSANCLQVQEEIVLSGTGTLDHSNGGDLFGGIRLSASNYTLSGTFGSGAIVGHLIIDGATVVSPVNDPSDNLITNMDSFHLLAGTADFGRRDVNVQFTLVQDAGTFNAAYAVRAGDLALNGGTFDAPPDLRIGQSMTLAPVGTATFEHHCGLVRIDDQQPAPFITFNFADHVLYDLQFDGGQNVAIDPTHTLVVLRTLQAVDAATLTLQSTVPGSTVLVDANNPNINVNAATDIAPAGLGYLGSETSGTAAANFQVPPSCKDNTVDVQEECDDGGGVGCSAGCTQELGYTCTGNPSVCPNTPVSNNNIIEPFEECDDGDADGAADGCEDGLIDVSFDCFGCGEGRCFIAG